MKRQVSRRLCLLLVSLLIISGVYLTYNTYGNFSFALQIRGKKLLAFFLVAVASSFGTICFQTLTQNHFLTPSTLGLDSLYVLMQTVLFFAFGGGVMLSNQTTGQFLLAILLMVMVSMLLVQFFLKLGRQDLFLLLMIGMIAGTLFSNISTFLQVIMDPNEYDLLQGKLFASFSNVNSAQLFWAAAIILISTIILLSQSNILDIFHLGQDQAVNLGVSLASCQLRFLFLVCLLTGTATALVGPIAFLGFIIANLSYRLIPTYHHRDLLLAGSLLGGCFLIGGQFLVEQVFHLNTTLSVVIEFVGGSFFIGKLFVERRWQK